LQHNDDPRARLFRRAANEVTIQADLNDFPKPDAALVTAGPFRFSRNPIYLGFLVVVLGFALRWGDLWGWLALMVCHLALDRLVVTKEEAYLSTRFGAAYEAYRTRVRRWV
jgi:protein-S-isoprenylcysteine O-methyltransferase Ste14